MDDAVHELQCQVRHEGKRCGKILGSAYGFVVPTGRVLENVSMIRPLPNYLSAWCKQCKRASEFVRTSELEKAA